MPTHNPHVVNQLRQLIYYHLDNDFGNNALFVAGRLHAYDPRSPESVHLLAQCHLRLGQIQAAYDCSKSTGSRGAHLGCAYVFARACLDLPRRRKEGIAALERSRGLWEGGNEWNKHSETSRRHLPDAAAVSCLLGKLYRSYGDTKRAVDCYVESLKLNPFMWDAFLALCETGANIRVPNIFKMTPEIVALLSTSSPDTSSVFTSIAEESPPNSGPLQLQHNPNNNPSHQVQQSDPFGASDIFGRARSMTADSPEAQVPALYQKLNECTTNNLGMNPVLSAAGGPGFEGLETPTGPVGSITSRFVGGGGGNGMAVSIGGVALASAAEPPQAPPRKHRTLHGIGMDFSIDGPPRMRSTSTRPKARTETDDVQESSTSSRSLMTAGAHKRTISGQTAPTNSIANDPTAAPQRRSVRLFNQIRPTSTKFSASTGSAGLREARDLKKAKATGTRGRTGAMSTVGRVVSGNRKPMENMDIDSKENQSVSQMSGSSASLSKTSFSEVTKQQEAMQWTLDLFGKLGQGYYALTHFQGPEALHYFNLIPASQKETPWVLAQIGRAYYEQGSYVDAEKHFRKIRTMAHSRLEDMEIYSTILWQLKDETELAFLAHELIDIDRLSPQAWCAVGNSFSLQRDHDQAVKCFKRATQLDPTCAYAYTHQGHEHVYNEEYDKALAAYRSGIAAESRYYNAWYGLGKVYEKMGKYDVAEKHYRTAAGINPTNAVLPSFIGTVLEKQKNLKGALEQYSLACELAPRSTFSRFKKARVLMAQHEKQLAHTELMILKDVAPDEANVHYLLGQLYKSMRQKDNAIKHLTIAMNLDPKAGPYIKEVMESLEEEDEDDDAEMSQ